MTVMKKDMELLAPAGGMAELKAAVQSGADAVYLGLPRFSARAGAANFDGAELEAAIEYCHAYGVKVHCAINTLVKETELDGAVEAARVANGLGADALIVQDLGLASEIRRRFPDIELHASTQMTVTSLEGVRFLEDMGFSRVVLARELSSKEIEAIARGARAELEVFVHGAVCMCYSGQCLMSSVLGGRSGNRGRCAQPCRLKYELWSADKKLSEAYALSPKDLALIGHLNELKALGAASLKIEGRLKSAEYVSAVTGIYRKYLDSGAETVEKEDFEELTRAFSRSGFTDGYFTCRLGAAVMAHDNPANNSGSIYSPAAKRRAAGVTERRVPINIRASLLTGDVLRLTADDGEGHFVYRIGAAAEPARTKPLTEERLREQLSKLGSTMFSPGEITAKVDCGLTVPISAINEERREICKELAKARAGREPKRELAAEPAAIARRAEKPYLTAEVMTSEQGRAVLEAGGVRRIYAPVPVAAELLSFATDTEIVSKTSDIFRPEEPVTETVSVSSAAALRYYGDRAQYGDFRLNICNSRTAAALSGLRCAALSPELNLREAAAAAANMGGIEAEIIGYGYLPLMLMKNCPVRALGGCANGAERRFLRDRKNMRFELLCGAGCTAILLNSKPIFTADMIEEFGKAKINCIRLNFTVEKFGQCGKIVDVYRRALEGGKITPPQANSFTRGHLTRGVR